MDNEDNSNDNQYIIIITLPDKLTYILQNDYHKQLSSIIP